MIDQYFQFEISQVTSCSLKLTKYLHIFQNSRQNDEGLRSNNERAVPLVDGGSRESILNIASIIILQDLNLATEDVQIEALEVWKRPPPDAYHPADAGHRFSEQNASPPQQHPILHLRKSSSSSSYKVVRGPLW